MKKNILLAALIVGLTVGGASAISRLVGLRWDFVIPAPAGTADIFRTWTPPSTYTLGNGSTTCSLIHTGKGMIVSVNSIGSLAGAVLFLDTISVANGQSYVNGLTADTTKIIAAVLVDTAKTGLPYNFPDGLPYSAGLVACPNVTSGVTSIGYRKQQE